MSEVVEETIPLEWPAINYGAFNTGPTVVEHISLTVNERCIDSIIDEIQFEFEHVGNRLKLLVGYPEFEIAIDQLIYDHRGSRQGFPPRIMDLLLKVYLLHIEKFGVLTQSVTTWMQNKFNKHK